MFKRLLLIALSASVKFRYPCSSLAPVPVFQSGSGTWVTGWAQVLRRVGARRPASDVGERAVLPAAVVLDPMHLQHLAAG